MVVTNILNLVTFMVILGILIIVHELGHFLFARKVGVRVEQFSLGFGPVLWKKKKEHTEYSVSSILLGGFVKLAGDNLEEYKGQPYEYFSKPPAARARIIFAGPLVNYLLGIIIFWAAFIVGFPTMTTKVGGLKEGSGAEQAGIQVGDKILAIDGVNIKYWEELQEIIHAKSDKTIVNITVLRDKNEFALPVQVKTEELDDIIGRKRKTGIIGIVMSEEMILVRHGFFESFPLSLSKTWELTKLTYMGLWRMVSGKLSMRESVTGPLGMYYVTTKVTKVGLGAVLHLFALLSVSLAIFNLLPLPILDGGHLLLLAVEKIRGKALSLKVDRIVTRLGLTFIVGLAMFVTYNDIIRFFGDKIARLFK